VTTHPAIINADATVRSTPCSASEQDVWVAIQAGQFVAHYQPILNADTSVRALEALARWDHPDGRTLPPSEFVCEAYAGGVLADIDRAVIKRALSDQLMWHRWELDLHANVDLETLADSSFADWLGHALSSRSFEARRLVLELDAQSLAATETTEGWNQVLQALTDVRALGVGIAIQSYQGAISPVLIENDLVTMLKLDQAITRQLEPVELWDQVIHTLGDSITESKLEVTAVGIVSDSSADAARELGCTTLQGFHYGFPTTSHKVLAAITTLDRK